MSHFSLDTTQHTTFCHRISFICFCLLGSHSIWFLFLLCITNIADSFLFVALVVVNVQRALNKLLRLKMCYTHKTFTITRERERERRVFLVSMFVYFVRYFLFCRAFRFVAVVIITHKTQKISKIFCYSNMLFTFRSHKYEHEIVFGKSIE